MKWFLQAFKQYADFKGRARRKEYWMFILFNTILVFTLSFLEEVLSLTGTIVVIYTLAIMVPSTAVTARRLHDIGKSGWWQLISYIPLIGGIILLVWLCTDSEKGNNRFGPNPKLAIENKDAA